MGTIVPRVLGENESRELWSAITKVYGEVMLYLDFDNGFCGGERVEKPDHAKIRELCEYFFLKGEAHGFMLGLQAAEKNTFTSHPNEFTSHPNEFTSHPNN